MCGVPVRALRVGFTGSLGWELHVAMDRLLELYDGLFAASDDGIGLTDIGSHALNSLRMEKAYLSRFELTHDIGPLQAGVERWVKRDRGDFIGLDALDTPPTGNDWRLVYLELDLPAYVDGNPDDTADALGGEAVMFDGKPVGLTTSGGYGFTVDKSLAFAFVSEDAAAPGTALTVMILGENVDATVLDGPVWDPENEELRG